MYMCMYASVSLLRMSWTRSVNSLRLFTRNCVFLFLDSVRLARASGFQEPTGCRAEEPDQGCVKEKPRTKSSKCATSSALYEYVTAFCRIQMARNLSLHGSILCFLCVLCVVGLFSSVGILCVRLRLLYPVCTVTVTVSCGGSDRKTCSYRPGCDLSPGLQQVPRSRSRSYVTVLFICTIKSRISTSVGPAVVIKKKPIIYIYMYVLYIYIYLIPLNGDYAGKAANKKRSVRFFSAHHPSCPGRMD
jgi:hypothetical protein